jgi:hypothetical protein
MRFRIPTYSGRYVVAVEAAVALLLRLQVSSLQVEALERLSNKRPVKAYLSLKTLAMLLAINSTTAFASSYTHLGNDQDAVDFYDAMAYIGSSFPDMVDKGSGGVYVTPPYGVLGGSLFFDENATEAHARSVWIPVPAKMASFPGMQKAFTNTTVFPFYQDFFCRIWTNVGKHGDATGKGATGNAIVADVSEKTADAHDSQRYGSLFRSLVDAGLVSEQDLGKVWSFLDTDKASSNVTGKRPAASIPKRQKAKWSDYEWNGDYSAPTYTDCANRQSSPGSQALGKPLGSKI